MDLSQKILENEKEICEIENKTSVLEALEKYNKSDKIMLFENVLNEIKEKGKTQTKVFMKIPQLDRILDGLREGQLVVLTAPTGQGKTAFLQSLTHTFSEESINSLWFSYEMPPIEMAERFIQLPKFYVPRQLKESSMEWLKMRILEGVAKFNTKVIFIDHLHYLIDMKMLSVTRNTSLAIGMIMRELKKLAVSTETIIFLVSHLKMTKLEQVPTIEDLRDSSFVGQEADLVLLMWRHKERDKESPTGFTYTNETRLVVGKNRVNGQMGYVRMLFENGRFMELTPLSEIKL